MARKIRNYEPEQPGLFSPELLGETPLRVAPGPSDPAGCDDDAEPSLADQVYQVGADREEPVFFMSFGSGSSGNCSYVGDSRSGFLIDAGVDAEKVKDSLAAHGISMEKVRGVVITHDHGDHVRFLYAMLKNNRHMLVYCTPKALNGMLRRHSISRRIKDYHRAVYKEFEFKIGNFVLTPFDVMHDGTDNCGFYIVHGGSRMAVATDIGCVSARAEHYLAMAQFMVLESNYDLEMLINGRYPDHLKARIRAENGHLDNRDAARFVARIYSPELRYLFLCHLSHDNNSPEVALAAHREVLLAAHPDVRIGDGTNENVTDLQLIALPRFDATPLYALRP